MTVVCVHCKMGMCWIHASSVLVMPVYSCNELQENSHDNLMIIVITKPCLFSGKTIHRHLPCVFTGTMQPG